MGVGELGLLNPNDIETITVLKDAQAIYLVLLVLTVFNNKKQVKEFKAKNQFHLYRFSGNNKVAWLNATEYALLLNES
jgi:hypothetical protein